METPWFALLGCLRDVGRLDRWAALDLGERWGDADQPLAHKSESRN